MLKRLKTPCYLPLLIALSLTVSSCSGSKKAFKQAQEYEQSGLFVQAAEYDLKALRDKPNFKEALAHLNQVAPKAFDELMQRASNHERAENWPAAVEEYEHTLNFLHELNRHGVVLATSNINEKLATAKHNAAKTYFAQAESLSASEQWAEAASAYLQAHHFVANYNDAVEAAIAAYQKEGDYSLGQRDFQRALLMYKNAQDVAPKASTNKRMAEAHYAWGRHYFNQGQYRNALAEFERSQKLVEGYKDSAEWAQRAYDQAVQYVGVFPFQNESNVPVDGYFIASEILGQAAAANLQFVDFLPEAAMNGLVSELRRRGRDRFLEVELLDAARREGLDSIVWGKIRRVRVEHEPESFKEQEHQKVTTVKDSTGKDIEESTPVYYREYQTSRRVSLDVEFYILEVESGKILDKQRFRDDIRDEARWIAYQGSIYDLPQNKRHYLDAPRDPRPPEVLIDELLLTIGGKISREVIRFYR